MENLDYIFKTGNDLVNLSNSLLKHFDVLPYHSTIEKLDEALKGHGKVCLFLFDGMGKCIVERHHKKAKSLMEHRFLDVYSVNPPTTVAATTAVLSGRYPIENGWLGWSMRFKGIPYPVDVFPNKNTFTGEEIIEPRFQETVAPYKTIAKLMEEKGHKAELLFPFDVDEKGPSSLREFKKRAERFFREKGEFLYAYWTNPDHLLHGDGMDSHRVRKAIRDIDRLVSSFAKENPDVLVLVIADHGHLNVRWEDLKDYPEIASLLDSRFSLEGRTMSLFVKEGKKEEFRKLFAEAFPSYLLLSREEALTRKLFGEGTPHPHALENIGDFVAIALGDLCLEDTRYKRLFPMKGHHAGGTKDEKEVTVFLYNH